ncbi:c-type cytochrome [Pseudogemmobacter sonorensis]|uniref:c-type cytochrome n=1 Tax=Pseudogemmobacter sonorensis TaxID=2989681 RepID=UPI003678A52D
MFDTMTMTKAVGALCGALLVFLLGNWAATALYSMESGGHGEDGPAQAYVIDTGVSEDGGAATDDGPSFADLYAAADVAAGERAFGKCRACHKLDGADITGPHLNGVVDREIASVGGFAYSSSMADHAGASWTPETLDEFLKAPRAFASNTKMAFAGLPRADERANLIAYLATQQ